MSIHEMNPKVDAYIDRSEKWQKELDRLRKIILDCGLKEELKWGTPCYTYHDSNTVLLHVFKEYCAMLFFKGALMQDPEGILVQQTENTQATRQIRFTKLKEITQQEAVLKRYVHEAIEVEKAGLKVAFKKTEEFDMPAEFKAKLDKDPRLKSAFEALTPGRQRGYLLHFSAAKQVKTRESRIEKSIPSILKGMGLND